MFNVKNNRTIFKLSWNAFKFNKMRNFFAIIAILLTTILFTSSFAIGGSVLSSMQESMMRQVGGDFHGGFKYLSEEQYDKLKTHKSIKVISYSVVLGIAENKELEKRATEIRYTNDDINAKGLFSYPTVGRLPEKDDELATDTLVLEKLGVPAEIGSTVTLEYSLGGEKRIQSFKLVGYWEGDILMSASQVWLNRTYVEKELLQFADRVNPIIGTMSADVKFANARHIEDKMIKVILDSGYDLEDIAYGVNWAYNLGMEGTFGFFVSISMFLGMIIFCGYLMISNIFYISIFKDVKYFGLLKTLGTTSRQIKKIIRMQVLMLCMMGIPLGLLIGKMIGVMLVPTVLSLVNVNVINKQVHPMIYLFSAFFTLLTIFISITKPSRIAEKVSPIEALRKTDVSHDKIRVNRKLSHHKNDKIFIRLIKMSIRNVMRNKKKMVLVTVSLALGLILLNLTFSLTNGFDMDAFLSEMIGSDFVMGDVSNFNVHMNYVDQGTLNPKFYETLNQQKGIIEKSDIYFHEVFAPTDAILKAFPQKLRESQKASEEELIRVEQEVLSETQLFHIYGLDALGFSRLKVHEGVNDYERLKSGKYVYVNTHADTKDVSYYDVGDKVMIPDTDGKEQEFEIIGVAEIPYNISIKHWHGITPTFYMASDIFLSNIAEKAPMLSTLNVEADAVQNIEKFLDDYVSHEDQSMAYQSKATLAAEYHQVQKSYKTVGLALSFIFAMIGILNYINTIMTSIHARRLEFAMTESIGMTRKQTMFMLVIESLLIIAITLIITFTIGWGVSELMLKALTQDSFFIKASFTALPSLLCVPILMLIAIIVTLMSQKNVYRTSVIERLREANG